MSRCAFEHGDEICLVKTGDRQIMEVGQSVQLGQQVCQLTQVGVFGTVRADDDQRRSDAQSGQPTDDQQCVAVGPLKVFEHQQQRTLASGP